MATRLSSLDEKRLSFELNENRIAGSTLEEVGRFCGVLPKDAIPIGPIAFQTILGDGDTCDWG